MRNSKITIEVLSIGDEILAGNILNTNTQFLSDQMWSLGYDVRYQTTVGDDELDITKSLELAASRAQIVLVTGGLGPTDDDFTIEIAARTFGFELDFHQASIDRIDEFLKARGRKMSDRQKKQALVPKGGFAMQNDFGTAPGIAFKVENTQFYFMPGVPREMKPMFKKHVLEHVKQENPSPFHLHTSFLRVAGLPESELNQMLEPVMKGRSFLDDARIGFRVQFPELMLKVSAWSDSLQDAKAKQQKALQQIQTVLGKHAYSDNPDDCLENHIIANAIQKGKTIATAESCTGGLIAHRLTNVSGSSQVFKGGLVTYSNALKQSLLRVSEKTLSEQGAVSEECAREMLKGLKQQTGADLCVSVTGIAGPTGGTKDKPVGTVYIGFDLEGDVQVKKFLFPFARDMFKDITANTALLKLYWYLASF